MTKRTPKKAAFVSLTLFLLFQGISGRSSASSLIQEDLATISEVQVVFPTGWIQLVAPPEIDIEALARTVQKLARTALKKEEIQVIDTAPQRLAIYVRYAIDKSQPGAHHTFLVRLELQEEATLVRKWASKKKSTVWVTSWSRTALRLTPENLALEGILEDVDNGVTAFAQKVAQARIYAATSTECKP